MTKRAHVNASKAPTVSAPQRGHRDVARDKLDALGLDAICDMILNGISMHAIAIKAGVDRSVLTKWAALEKHSARVNEARMLAASIWDEKAEQCLEAAMDPISVSVARELAHHYRWRASKIAPKIYGDKQAVEHSGSVSLTDLVNGSMKPDTDAPHAD